jgi:hypothetical protein
VRFHEFSHDFVFLLDLGFEQFDFAVFGIVIGLGFSAVGKGKVSVLEELFEPVVDLIGMQLEFIAEIGNGNFVDEMPFKDGNLLVNKDAVADAVFFRVRSRANGVNGKTNGQSVESPVDSPQDDGQPKTGADRPAEGAG